jgi:hypothetical protein
MQKFSLYAILFLISSSMLIFQNCGQFDSETSSKVGGYDQITTASFRYANNQQQPFTHKVFGPSPQGEDSRLIFNTRANASLVREAFWRQVRTQFDTVLVHILHLDFPGPDGRGFYQYNSPEKVAFNDNQILGVKKLQQQLNFKIAVELGSSLGKICEQRTLWRAAQDAVDMEMALLSRLIGAGIEIDIINVDGPFLRLISGSQKAFSCATTTTASQPGGLGFSQSQSVEIVGRFIARLQRAVNSAQGSMPDMHILLNLPNWQVGTVPGRETIDLLNLVSEFAATPFYPQIAEVVLDYPHSYIRANRSHFASKIDALEIAIRSIRGRPNLSFIINTETAKVSAIKNLVDQNQTISGPYAKGKRCLAEGVRVPNILVYENNTCLTKQIYAQRPEFFAEDEEFIKSENETFINESIQYYLLVKYGLPVRTNNRGRVIARSIYMQTWHDFPRSMIGYGLKATNILAEEFNN